MTRRGALSLGGAGVAVVAGLGLGVRALGGPGSVVDVVRRPRDPGLPGVQPGCVAAGALTAATQLRGIPLVYDESGDRTSFRFEPTFRARLESWLPRHASASGLGNPAEVWTLGSWVAGDPSGSGVAADGTVDTAGGCRSWHNAGRAFDLTRLVDGTGQVVVSARYDLWSRFTGAQLETTRARYWRTVAGLHRDFDSVLTYLYNDLHHTHVHIDDGRVNGTSGSLFRAGSRVQVQAVQAMCSYVWGRPVDTTGEWDGATRDATAEVLAQTGVGGALTDGGTAWHGFLDATLAHRG
ncbi:MAG: hypothetical protein M3Y71_04380 [Actinomycetota bacterium]|nr:hypothetical protein [Actinomycetota bacterium]